MELEIVVYPIGADKIEPGPGAIRSIMRQLIDEVKSFGVEQLRIKGDRVSGAQPGKKVDITIDLSTGRIINQ